MLADVSNAPALEELDCGQPVPPMQLLHRVTNLVVILVPFAALIAAIALVWGWGVRWIDVVLLIGLYLASGLGVTIGFHRLFTHRSFETGPILRTVFAVLGSMAVEGPVLRWVATHRCHHQHSDQDGDPHSPHDHDGGFWNIMRGLWHAHVGWVLRPLDDSRERYIADYDSDRLVRVLSALFPLWVALGMLIPAVVGGLVTRSWSGVVLGVLWGGLVRVFFVHHITWSINSVCHVWGKKPFRCHDESRNNAIFGVLAFGEGWHNNHHAFPTSARHGLKWWQIDTSYMIIVCLSKLRLVWNIRLPSPERIAAKRVGGATA